MPGRESGIGGSPGMGKSSDRFRPISGTGTPGKLGSWGKLSGIGGIPGIGKSSEQFDTS